MTTPTTGDFPCPACGFLVFAEPPGSYVICGVCDWEDDAVQLANPCSAGGANRASLADAQQHVLHRYPANLCETRGIARDPAWRPLSDAEREWALRAIELSKSSWPSKATESYYWRDPWETVYTMTDYYDGPRAGIADFEGKPHRYESTWNDMEDDYDDVLVLRPVDDETFRLALEDWQIWLRWERAFYAGEVPQEVHPALPKDRARHLEIAKALAGKLPPSGASVRAKATFQTPPRPEGQLGWLGLRARWRRVA